MATFTAHVDASSLLLSESLRGSVDLYFSKFMYILINEGGRDLKGTKTNPKNLRTAPQSKDQTLTRGNLALSKNVETKLPVRVIRGYKLDSAFAPEEGYRYDGLYTVEKCWFTTGVSGFGVWKFALKRCPNQAPPPWTVTELNSGEDSTDDENSRGVSDVHQVQKKAKLQTKSKDFDEVLAPKGDTSRSSSLLDTKSSENIKASNGNTEEETAKHSTGNINGSSQKQPRDNDTGTGDKIDQYGSEEELKDEAKVENSTPEENVIVNKENVKIGTDKSNTDLKTVKHEMNKNVPNCESESKTLQGDSVEEGYDNLTTEDDPER